MPRWRFWEQPDTKRTTETAPESLQRRRPPRAAPTTTDPAKQQGLEQLRQRRELVMFDVERAGSARHPENQWQERIDLLAESIATVEADLAALDAVPPTPRFPLPPTPITDLAAQADEPSTVAFTIGDEAFQFAEEPDWDERGGARVRGDLRQRTGEAAALVPAETPDDRREALAAHLRESVTVFATDLRDRAIDSKPVPVDATLADLAQPCETCGGWRDWRGTCERCARRAWERQQLESEARRLTAEQETEAGEQHKWAERLPIARRRLADVDAEIAKLAD